MVAERRVDRGSPCEHHPSKLAGYLLMLPEHVEVQFLAVVVAEPRHHERHDVGSV